MTWVNPESCKSCGSPSCSWINEDGSRGCSDKRCLQIDHVFGGGVQERKKLGSKARYLKVLNDQSGVYQLLCANCNWIKRHVNDENKGRSAE